MPVDLRLKLLQLTNRKCAVNVKDLGGLPRTRLDETLIALIGNGLASVTDGFLIINGRQRVMLAEQLIHAGVDPKRVSSLLGWQEFEDFAEDILLENGFSTRKHFIFKSSIGRREIDIFAWNDTFTLAVDCKHWVRSLSSGRMRDAAHAQVERATALARHPELFYRLSIPNSESRSIMPMILTLGETRDRLIESVPIVSVSKLLNFLYDVSPIDPTISRIPIIDASSQTRLT